MKPVDPRLLRHAAAARGYLILTVGLGLATTALILAQAGLLAHALAAPATGIGVAALAATLGVLLAVLAARAVTAYGGELAALRAAAAVKSQLRRKLTAHALRLGPAWLGGQQAGEIATLSTKGLDALDPYFARFLPQLVLAFLVPVAVLIRVGLADWVSALVIAVTLPLIPLFAVLIGLQTRAQTERQWQLLARLGGHFLDVVEGLPTLKLFGRARNQTEVIAEVTDAHRRATMRTLRVAFLSALVLELSAAVATALVAVEVGLRLLAGHLPYQTALLVLLLTPEAYLPLRAVGMQFHASMEGVTAAGRACEILDTPVPQAPLCKSSTAAPAGRGPGSGPPRRPAARAGVWPAPAGRPAARAGVWPAPAGRPAARPYFPQRNVAGVPGPGRASAGPGVAGDPARRADRGDWPERGGEELPARAAPAVRRTGRRADRGRPARGAGH